MNAMADWIAIAAGAVSLVGAFIGKVGDGFTQKIGEEIYGFLKRRFGKHKHASKVLAKFAENRDRYEHALVHIVRESIDNDSEFAGELMSLMEKAQTQRTGEINQVAIGRGISQSIGKGSSSRVNIDRAHESARPKTKSMKRG